VGCQNETTASALCSREWLLPQGGCGSSRRRAPSWTSSGYSKLSNYREKTLSSKELTQIIPRNLQKRGSKLKHGAPKWAKHPQSELRRSRCFSPLSYKSWVMNPCIKACWLTLNAGSSFSSLLTFERLARILIIRKVTVIAPKKQNKKERE